MADFTGRTTFTSPELAGIYHVESGATADGTRTETIDRGHFWVTISAPAAGTPVHGESCDICGRDHGRCSHYWRALCDRARRRAWKHVLVIAQINFQVLLADPRPDWIGCAEPRLRAGRRPQPQRAAVLPYRRALRPKIKSRRRREWRPRGRRGVA